MEYKLSNYIVITDPLYEDDNVRILFSTRTSKAITISADTYSKLQNCDWYNISDKKFKNYIEKKIVVPQDENELEEVIKENEKAIDERNSLYYVLQPTAMCQLGCGYCGQEHTKKQFSQPTHKKIIDRIESKLKTKLYNHLSIAWFGAEPLLGLTQIRSMTPELMNLCDKYGCSYGSKMVSNGLSLKEHIFVELAQKFKVNQIEVTLDGTAEYHDARRHTKSNLSTFDLIFKNLLRIWNRPDFKELGCDISIRCNVDERNFEGVVPLMRLLAKHELQDKISNFYVAPIHSWGNDAHLLSLEKQKFADLQIGWLIEQYKLGFKIGLIPSRKRIVCLSVDPLSEVIDASGKVYDCSETPYVPVYEDTEYVLGNLNDGIDAISKKRPLLDFNSDIMSGSLPCSTCEMLPVCGGMCPKHWKEGIIACPPTKFNIKDKLKLKYLIQKKGKEAMASALAESETL